MTDVLIVEKTAQCWTFTLNRPDKRNALSANLIEALIVGIQEAHKADIPLLVFRGAGKNFSAGFDFSNYEEHSEADLTLRFIRIEQCLQLIAASPALTLGLAHGRNFGAGVDLFAACKLRYCTPTTQFRLPGLKFGLILGSRRFASLVGADKAVSILGAARPFDASEAQEIDFVTALKESADWPTAIQEAVKAANELDANTRAQLYAVLNNANADADLASLVRSAAQPGLKERIRTYLGRTTGS